MAWKSASSANRWSVMTNARRPSLFAIRPSARRCPLPNISSRGDLIVPKCSIAPLLYPLMPPYRICRLGLYQIVYYIVFDIEYLICHHYFVSRTTYGELDGESSAARKSE